LKKIILIKQDHLIFHLEHHFRTMKDFIRSNFFPLKKIFKLNKLIDLLKDEILLNKINNNFDIIDLSSLNELRDKSVIFLDSYLEIEKIKYKNIHVISNIEKNNKFYDNITIIKNLNFAYNLICNKIFYHEDNSNVLDEFNLINGSYISKFSKIHETVQIGYNCVIARGVEINKNCIIKNNVVIKNSLIGNNAIICDNSTIGSTGFGFDFKTRGSTNLNPQIGITILDDNVHIGSSCTIDRGKIDITYIGKNSMIDNMVHIGHNVIIGNNACIAAQTGISGSVKIGENVTIGGQTGFAGHITIGENVTIAAKSGVTKSIKDHSVVAGFPAIDMKEWKKIIIKQRKYGH
tara:strand:+ start:1131 stop:2174 length:1044 start_codon:yes stop_codon:yes gene_type:complete